MENNSERKELFIATIKWFFFGVVFLLLSTLIRIRYQKEWQAINDSMPFEKNNLIIEHKRISSNLEIYEDFLKMHKKERHLEKEFFNGISTEILRLESQKESLEKSKEYKIAKTNFKKRNDAKVVLKSSIVMMFSGVGLTFYCLYYIFVFVFLKKDEKQKIKIDN